MIDIRAAVAARAAQTLIVPPASVIEVPKIVVQRASRLKENTRDVTGQFDVVLMDPPWWYANRLTGEGRSKFGEGASGKYGCMTDDELMSIRELLRAVLAPQAVIFMWTTCPRLDFAMDLGRMWGLKYSTKAFSWFKTTIDSSGFRNLPGKYTASNTEDVLLFTYNEKGYTDKKKLTPESVGGRLMTPQHVWQWAEEGDSPQFVEAPHLAPDWWDATVEGPYMIEAANGATTAWPDGTIGLHHRLLEHSRKPNDVHERIDEMYPSVRKLELFARRPYRGWACLGNEIDGLDIGDALSLAATGYYDL